MNFPVFLAFLSLALNVLAVPAITPKPIPAGFKDPTIPVETISNAREAPNPKSRFFASLLDHKCHTFFKAMESMNHCSAKSIEKLITRSDNSLSSSEKKALLVRAVRVDRDDLVQQFLVHGTMKSVNEPVSSKGFTILHWAAVSDSRRVIRFLRKIGANVNVYDENGWSALHWAAKEGKFRASKELVRDPAIKIQLTVQNYKVTALDLAEGHKNYKIVKLLIQEGAKVVSGAVPDGLIAAPVE